MFRAPAPLFRVLAIAEAISWTLLIGGLIVRAVFELPIAVTIGGGVHGFVFLAYGATAVLLAKNQRWRPWPAVIAIASAVIPYATIPAELCLARTGRLEGQWRLAETDDPRDRAWHDRLMRTLLNRPWLFGVLLVVLVVVIFVVLLIIGPPGGSH